MGIRRLVDWISGYERVDSVELSPSTSSGAYVNFTVDGHNTFIADTYLTHNCIVDDPHSEQAIVGQGAATAMPPKEHFEKVYNWFTSIRGRLEPGASIIIVMQRWAMFDLTGRLMEDMKLRRDGDQWEIIELPALLQRTDDSGKQLFGADGQPLYDSLWPQRWPVEELLKLRASLIPWKWQSQYMQDPKSEEGAIVKREFWKIWGQKFTRRPDGTEEAGEIDYDRPPPVCEHVIQSWDTAYTAKTRSDYSACTTWGVFRTRNSNEREVYNAILLDASRWKLEYHELKQKAIEKYKQFQPDICIVEAKAAGLPLIHDMRRMGIPISDYTPTARSGDKVARVNAVSDLFASGFVWVPPRQWAYDVIEEFAMFPNGDHDDLVDSATQALLRFRLGGFISAKLDEEEEEYEPPVREYY